MILALCPGSSPFIVGAASQSIVVFSERHQLPFKYEYGDRLHQLMLSWRSWQRVGLIILRPRVRSSQKAGFFVAGLGSRGCYIKGRLGIILEDYMVLWCNG